MKKTFWLLPVWLFALSLGETTAQTIDFETLPDGSLPADRLVISNQYLATFGVSFQFEDGTYPQIAHVGAPRTAFGGPPNHSSADQPAPNQSVRRCFLTDDGLVLDPPPPLIVAYAAPVSAASGVLLDLDGDEAWRIEVHDAGRNVLDAVTLTPASPNAGDGRAVPWTFRLSSAKIWYVRIAYVGGATITGLAFDNFSPALPAALPALHITMIPEGAQVQVTASFGSTNRLDYADSLRATKWQALTTLVHTNAPQEYFLDATAPQQAERYYRAVGF